MLIKNNLPDLVGKGYKQFWNYKGRYRVVKGSRASKKSKTTALWYIVHMCKHADANLLVLRKTERALKDSCFKELRWAIHTLGLDNDFYSTVNPLEITRLSTGQKIYFRGLDNPLKITSIAVEHGNLCWAWIEEAYEILNEDDFDILDESIRGKVEAPLFKQITLTFNPWNERHWLKKRFFDTKNKDVLALTTTYKCNEWLDDSDKRLFATMKKNNPRRYQVAGLGNWGIVEGVVYENWKEQKFKTDKIKGNLHSIFGLDFGYTNDPSALFCGSIDLDNKKIYVFDEMYEKGLSNRAIYDKIDSMGYGKESITADSAEPKSIDELRGYGLRVKGAVKGPDSILNGIQFIQDFEIIVHPVCVNFITEISNYTWDKDKFGNMINRPVDDFNHLMDAMRYGVERYIRNKGRWLI